jgi:diguanylate cyclase (GGDEF)-like protein
VPLRGDGGLVPDDHPKLRTDPASWTDAADRAAPGEGPAVGDAIGLRVLLVEDSEFDARLILEQLRAAAPSEVTTRHVVRLEDAHDELSLSTPDCVLLDLNLPDASGLHGLETLLAAHPDVPVVVLSASDEAVLGSDAVQAGAQDYLTKGEIDGRQLWRAIRYAMERKRSQLMLQHQAMHDALTGLPNRVLFLDRLTQALARLSRRDGQVAVLFLDLDGFKWVNDSLGHEAGDAVVVEVARRLQSALRPYDTAARIGGDEFLVLAEAPEDDEKAAIHLAERIREQLMGPIRVGDTDVRVSASVGITCTSDSTAEAPLLIRDADAAMYRAKALGKNRWALFDASMREQAERRVRLLNDLHRALEARSFTALYQPVVSLATGQVQGWEALLRWRLEDGTLVTPKDFLAVLEEHGLMVPVGQLVLENALEWLAQRAPAAPGTQPPYMSVNLSPLQLTQHDVVGWIDAAVQKAGLRHDQLHLELTESRQLSQDPLVRQRLTELKDLGLRLAMDDYGTGASTLGHLKELPFDLLKIDRTFVAALSESEPDRRIVQAIIAMGQSLGLEVVAEGVETEDQAQTLREMGCTYGQGQLFGPPSASGELVPRTGGALPLPRGPGMVRR